MSYTYNREGKTLEELQDDAELAFESEFMKPDIEFGDWIDVETKNGERNLLTLEFFNPREYTGKIKTKTHRKKYGARLSAPGYIDSTEWACLDTEEEAYAYLLDAYTDI